MKKLFLITTALLLVVFLFACSAEESIDQHEDLDSVSTTNTISTTYTTEISSPIVEETQVALEETESTEAKTPSSSTNTSGNTGASSSNSNIGSSHVHSFGSYKVNEFKAPTETSPGEVFRFCSCGYRDSRKIPSLNYNVTDPASGKHICVLYTKHISATCIRREYQVTLCTGCDYRFEYDGSSSTALANHTYSDWTINKEATETKQGERTRTCSVCGNKFSEIIPATGEQREEYIDPRISIEKLPDGATRYTYNSVSVTDTRTWGDPPVIRITDDGGFNITYWKADGSKMIRVLTPVKDAHVWITIREDGTYTYGIFDGFDNVDGSGS